MNQLVDELAHGNRLEFREFGIFDLKQRKARKARNPRTGDEVSVKAKTVVVFRPGKTMRERVDSLPTQAEPRSATEFSQRPPL